MRHKATRLVFVPILGLMFTPIHRFAGVSAAAAEGGAGPTGSVAPSSPAQLPPPRYCTRSLGVVDCWTNPGALNGQPHHQVADGPTTLTPAQQASSPQGWH